MTRRTRTPNCEPEDQPAERQYLHQLLEASTDRLRYRLAVEEAIAAAFRLLVHSATPDLTGVLRLLGEAVAADRAYLFRIREDGRILDNTHEWCNRGAERPIETLQGLEAAHFPWWMEQLHAGANLTIPDVSKLPDAANGERRCLEAQSVHSLLVVPIFFSDGRLVGFMGFDDVRGTRAWKAEDTRALRMLGDMIAARWEQAESEEQARHRDSELRGLIQQLNRVTTPKDAAQAILETADRLLGWDAAWLNLCIPDQSRIEPVLLMDRIAGERVEVTSRIHKMTPGGMIWRSLQEGPFLINRSPEELEIVTSYPPTFGNESRRSASILCVPIWDGEAQIGALSIQSYEPGSYTEADLKTLQTIVEHCAGALKRCQAEAEHARLVEERLQAERAKRESEETLRFAMTAARLGVWDRDLHNGLVTWTAYSQIREDGEPHSWTQTLAESMEAIVPEDRELLIQASDRAIQENTGLAIEFRMMVPGLGERWVASRGHVLRDPEGQPLRLIGIGEDITERKRLELALREQQGLLDAVLENVTEGVLAFDLSGTLTYCNRAARERYGVGALPLPFSEWTDRFRIFHSDGTTPMAPEDMPLTYATRGQSLRDVEVVAQLPTGEKRHLLVSAHPMRNVDGEQYGVVSTFHDITAGRELEEQLRQSQKMEAVGRLAGGVAHDFNNMLAVVNGYSQLLLSRPDLDSAAKLQLREIQQAGERAASLTGQLLAFSRKQVVAPRRLDLRAVLSNMGGMLRRLIGEDVQLVTSPKGEPVAMVADPGQIEQVLLNLVVNARDAMPRGGTLVIETEVVEVDPTQMESHSGVTPGRYALLAVSDTGHGMDHATQQRVFEPFFTTKPAGTGTGLGLSTVYGIVKQWGGHLRLNSEPGRGTTFRIYFPLAEGEAENSARALPPALVPGSETILLVEDDRLVRRLTREILGSAGYTVLDAPNPVEALRILQERDKSPDLVLTDIVMPQMSGRELAERLGALRPGIRVLYMSGYTDDAVVRHGIMAAEVEFIQKPFTPAELTRRVRELLDRTDRA